MNAHALNAEQRDKLKRLLVSRRDELARLAERMRAVGWFTDDPLFNSVVAAQHALHAAVNALAGGEDPALPDWARRIEGG